MQWHIKFSTTITKIVNLLPKPLLLYNTAIFQYHRQFPMAKQYDLIVHQNILYKLSTKKNSRDSMR